MNRRLAREVVRMMDAHQPFVRAVVVRAVGSVPGKPGATLLVRIDGTTLGTVGGAVLEERVKELAAEAFRTETGGLHHFDLQSWKTGGLASLCGGSVDISVEYVPARPNLLLWGGGHVAQAIAALLPGLEYDYSVADDRPEWVTVERFPDADARVVVEPDHLWTRFVPETFSHLYVLGYDAQKDLEVLARSVGRFSGYIGLIASASKREHLFATLRTRGVPESKVSRIHSPIGLAIGAETPAEIAVAVIAEVVQQQHPPSSVRPASALASSRSEEDVRSHAS